MRMRYLLIGLLLLAGCTDDFPTRKLREVRIVGHVPARVENPGNSWTEKTVYEHWIYEITETGERFVLTTKYGELGEVVKIRR
jgi:hypothetical protein